MLWRYACLFLGLSVAFGCLPNKEPVGGSQQSLPAPAEEVESVEQSSGGPAAVAGKFPHVITTGSAYYVGGPQQARPPDGTLMKGTRVRVIQNAGSYSIVRTADGIEGYISTAAIGPAVENSEKK